MNTRQGMSAIISRRALALVCALLLLAPAAISGGQRGRSTRTKRRSASGSAARPVASPTPIVVPRLAPTPRAANTTTSASAARTTQPSAQQQPSAPKPTQTPAATPPPQKTQQQEDAAEEDEEIVRVTSNLVVVPTSVTNANGEPVQNLKREDFRLEEEGRAQEIAEVGTAEQVPLDIAILFDASSSVTAKKFYDFQQEAAARFLKQVLKPTDRAAIFAVADRPRLEQALASAEVASAKLTTIPAADRPVPTAFYDSVISAARYLAQNAPGRHRRVIVCISDGEDNFSEMIRETSTAEARGEIDRATSIKRQRTLHERALREVQREVQRADAVFYSINPSGPGYRLNDISTRAQQSMQQIAEATGGTAYVPENTGRLDTVFRQIANELRAQYLLQYYSNSGAPPGKYLSIKVQTPSHTEVRVRARQGYYVPQPK